MFESSTLDTTSYVIAIVVILLVALLASFLPSLRAAQIDPAVTLRGN